MRQKAKSIGADAIIPFEDASEYELPGVIYNPWLGDYQILSGGKVPILRGYAIKYTNLSYFFPLFYLYLILFFCILSSISRKSQLKEPR